MTHTRESWLQAAIALLSEDFERVGATFPDLRVTCGWPSRGGRGKKKRTLGEAWPPTCSEDGHTEIFIAPTLSETLEVLEVLTHELVHAAVGCEEGHKGQFRVVAKAIGLEGKMTSTNAGETLMVRLREIEKELVDYPHAKLTPKHKPQSTRMLKLLCPDCGWSARTSQKWIDAGLPDLCLWGENESRMITITGTVDGAINIIKVSETTFEIRKVVMVKCTWWLPIIITGKDTIKLGYKSTQEDATNVALTYISALIGRPL